MVQILGSCTTKEFPLTLLTKQRQKVTHQMKRSCTTKESLLTSLMKQKLKEKKDPIHI